MSLKQSTKYREIADKLIDKYPTVLGHIDLDKVVFLEEDQRTPKKYADCRRIAWPWNYFSDMKFMIIFYTNNIVSMTEAQEVMLVFHELLHIAEDFEKLRKHDVEDFSEVLSIAPFYWDHDPNLKNLLEDDQTTPVRTSTQVQLGSSLDDEDEPEA